MALEVTMKKKLGDFELDVAFAADGGVFAILGASGCGKSMTLKCIAGIETPDEGRIVLDGRVLYDSEARICLPPQKRRVGYLFQDYALFPHMTVVQNIQTGMGRRPDQKKTAEYLERFRLLGLERAYPEQLSGGQKQRVAIARMLAAEPELLLLDEPFAALDSHLKWEMEQQMREILQESKKPALFVSHSRDEVYRLCSTVSCLNSGKMERPEPTEEFFRNPKTRTAAILSGCKNISRAERIDSHRLRALDWDQELILPEREIPEGVSAVGIRAHYFRKCDAVLPCQNCFVTGEYRILEDLFEWNLSFRRDEKCAWMQWKIAKNDWNPSMGIPAVLTVSQEDILLLTDPG